MRTDSDKNGISRLGFLKRSGTLAAGFTLLHGAPFAGNAASAVSGKWQARLFTEDLASCQLVVPAQAVDIEEQAARRLQHYLYEISGISLPIFRENAYQGDAAIYLGRTDYAKEQAIGFDRLQADGYTFKPLGSNLIIAGGTGKGLLYGVYRLLESLGCRKFTSAATLVPKRKKTVFPDKEVTEIPFISYRSTSYRDTRDEEYADWHALSSRDSWGLFVHTFDKLVPRDEYGATHPEYFSLRDGVRRPGTQLCLSQQEVLETVITNLRKEMAKKPEALYWSVSQNDNDQYCQCSECKALNDKYGGVPAGSILHFTNAVARVFPEKIISTLAYWYSRAAPTNIKAEPNVNIMLCNIESRRHQPVYETDPAFANDLKQWGQLASNIIIWDYNIQFTNLVSPFPNLHTIKPNIKFYTENGVNSLFMQANSQQGGEMAGLRAYLICKLMWNPDADDEAIIDEYLDGYYGPAGRHIRQYIDQMRSALLKSGFPLSIFGDPIDAKDSYLSADMMSRYKRLFDKAEKAASKDPELLRRVKAARLPLMYAEIQIGRQEIDTPRSMYRYTKNGKVIAKPAMVALVNEFVRGCKEEGVTRLRERSTPPADYLRSYTRIFVKMDQMNQAISLHKKIIPITTPANPAGGVEKLTDGLFGSYESWSNPDSHWLGYKGQHVDFILDLGEVRPINTVGMDFLNVQAQPDWNLLALPRSVTYAISEDGESYRDTIKIDNPHNPNPKENPEIAGIPVQSFQADFKKSKGRFIKVHAESLLKMPAWHIRAGQPVWLYCDEIVVT